MEYEDDFEWEDPLDGLEDLQDLMEEGPGGAELPDPESYIHIAKGDERYYGMGAHRGVVSKAEQELIDPELLDMLASEELGQDIALFRDIYSKTKLTAAERFMRTRLDLRLWEVKQAGGNMVALARIIGMGVKDGESRAMNGAIKRAADAQSEGSSRI